MLNLRSNSENEVPNSYKDTNQNLFETISNVVQNAFLANDRRLNILLKNLLMEDVANSTCTARLRATPNFMRAKNPLGVNVEERSYRVVLSLMQLIYLSSI